MKRLGYRDPFIHSRRWKELRLQILVRDNWTCQIAMPGCLVTADSVDHVVRRSDGGHRSDPANLRAACKRCNNKRNNPRFLGSGGQRIAPLANLSPRDGFSPLTGDYSRNEADDGDSAA